MPVAPLITEVEFTTGVWTDVSADVDMTQGVTIQIGRTSQFSQPSAGTSQFALNNKDGRYSPGRQLLADGVTAHPHYPNVVPRKRVRHSYAGTGPNLVVNGTFETNISGWAATAGTASRSTGGSHSGVAALLMTWPTAGAGTNCYTAVTGCAPGWTYTATAWVFAASGQPVPKVWVFDSNAFVRGTANGSASSAWVQVSFTFVATTPTMNIGLTTVGSTTAGNTAYIDDVTITATRFPRFVGFVKGWPPSLVNGQLATVKVNASDRLDQLARNPLRSPIAQEISADAPTAWWPMTDPAGSFAVADGSTWPNDPLSFFVEGSGVATVTFGAAGAGVGDGTGLSLVQTDSADGQFLYARTDPWLPQFTASSVWSFTAEIYCQTGSVPSSNMVLWSWQEASALATNPVYIGSSTGHVVMYCQDGTAATGGPSVCDGSWHHVLVTYVSNGTTATETLYLDGAVVAAHTGTPLQGRPQQVRVAQIESPFASALYTGGLGHFAFYPRALPVARIVAHAQATVAYANELTGARVGRHLGQAGILAAEMLLQPGRATVGTYPQNGKYVLQAVQDVATSEGAGSAVYVSPSGQIIFNDRRDRLPISPNLTVDADKDLIGSSWSPSFDDATLVNLCNVTRSSASGGDTTQTAVSAASVAQYGQTGASVTTYTTTDLDALALGQSYVAAQAYPGFRLNKVTVDLLTGQTAGLLTSVQQVLIGDRIRITGLPLLAAPSTQLDVITEGWTEVASASQWMISYDTSAADNPASGRWDSALVGLWQPDTGSIVLNGALTVSATTIVVQVLGGSPMFTTAAGSYPLTVQIGAEIITLNGAPSTAGPTQTFTGVTRGQNGTVAAAQAIFSVVSLYPLSTWTL